MANTAAQDDKAKSATGDYSATKAPENREHVTSRAKSGDPKLTPGGPQGAPVEVGMEALDSDLLAADVEATKDQVDYGINPAKDRRDSGNE